MTLDAKLFQNIPRPASTGIKWVSDRRRESPIPRAGRAFSFAFSWFCIPGGDWGSGKIFEAYCGAPPGIRCACGAQLHGHDPGDEDDHKENGIR